MMILRKGFIAAGGCDGARSTVRGAPGLTLEGDSANHAWGVLDALVFADFPDTRFRTLINAKNGETIVLIPHEGGYLVRIYVEMEKLSDDERVRRHQNGWQPITRNAGRWPKT